MKLVSFFRVKMGCKLNRVRVSSTQVDSLWRWYTEIRTTTAPQESAAQADGCPATSLAVNSNLGEAKFESGKNWTWYTPIRTALERPFNFRISLTKTHEYQRISAKAKQLRAKGLSWSEIGRRLKVTDKTVKKAVIRGGK